MNGIDHLIGVAMIRGDDGLTPLFQDGVHHPAYAFVHRPHRLHRKLTR